MVPEDHPYGVHNLPFGVFSDGSGPPRAGVAVGEEVLDLAPLLGDDPFRAETLNPFLARGRPFWDETRRRLQDLLTGTAQAEAVRPHLFPREAVRLHLPFEVADFADFYSSLEHATRAGRILRPGEEPLKPNWRHLPVGYHGRAGTVIVSGTPVRRPYGQLKPPDAAPELAPTRRLDLEAEIGYVVGTPSIPGARVTVDDFHDHVFGLVLLIDWSARDIQAWEAAPLGPFLAKSFATTISPWVVPLDALGDAWVPSPPRDPAPLPYLTGAADRGLDLRLEVEIGGTVVSRPPYRSMYWTPAQQLAHLTVNGARLRTGDLYGSGTVSGDADGTQGSLLELTVNGARPMRLDDGSELGFLRDGDAVVLRGHAPGPGGRTVGLGEARAVIEPATA
ncbi:MAG: fumarylacetoacetase [Streptosporangiales bacterium]|nr:fumarylacetoacetase [Streptosporangiales bacterium]